jgi:cupin fold WbuC family metalloprotein
MQLLTQELIDGLIERARAAPRRRINHNFHSGPEDNPHRFLNVLVEGTYVQPHRHLDPPKSETFLVLAGRVGVLLFAGDGTVLGRHVLGPEGDSLGIDLEPGVWHTIVCLSPHAVCFEVKPGPWQPASDKEFASWAPREGDAGVAAYLDRLVTCFA